MGTAGESFYDTARLSYGGDSGYTTVPSGGGSSESEGTVSYEFYTGSSCSGTGTSLGTVSVESNGEVPNSNPTGPLSAGYYSFQATYTPDGKGKVTTVTSPCEHLIVLGDSLSTSICLVGGPCGVTTGILGETFYDTAALTVAPSGGPTPTGTVTYNFYSGTCSGTLISSTTVTLSGGTVPQSQTVGPLKPGFYSFQATYTSTNGYPTTSSVCTTAALETLLVTSVYPLGVFGVLTPLLALGAFIFFTKKSLPTRKL
jgi:hypothetical protein